MDVAAHYRHLIALGREEFLAAAAPAAFVRHVHRLPAGYAVPDDLTMGIDETQDVEGSGPHLEAAIDLEVFPLIKKPGASFAERITIGRTQNNDVVIVDHSVSRFHAYVRQAGAGWIIADAGSKNGTWLRGALLEARRELQLPSRAVVRLGDIDLTFYVASDLFEALGGS